MSRKVLPWWRCAGPALVFAVLVWRLGTGPFLEGLRRIDGGALAAAAGIAVLTTVAYAWRWKLVAGGLGLDLSLPAAVAAYYRSLFLNAMGWQRGCSARPVWGAQRGVATAVAYGVMVLVASLPGIAVLVVAWVRRSRRPPRARSLMLVRAAGSSSSFGVRR